MKAAAAAAAAAASSIPAVSSGADIDTDELVDETGVEPKDIELIMSQVRHFPRDLVDLRSIGGNSKGNLIYHRASRLKMLSDQQNPVGCCWVVRFSPIVEGSI